MNQKSNILAAFLVLALALLLTACGTGGDRVERFAKANPGSGENIAIPDYENIISRMEMEFLWGGDILIGRMIVL